MWIYFPFDPFPFQWFPSLFRLLSLFNSSFPTGTLQYLLLHHHSHRDWCFSWDSSWNLFVFRGVIYSNFIEAALFRFTNWGCLVGDIHSHFLALKGQEEALVALSIPLFSCLLSSIDARGHYRNAKGDLTAQWRMTLNHRWFLRIF